MTTSPTKMTTSSIQATSTTPAHVFDWPITHSRAMKLQQEVHSLLCEFYFNIDENYILSKLCMLLLLRFTKEDDKDTPIMNQRGGPRRISSAWQDHQEELVISFDSLKLWRCMSTRRKDLEVNFIIPPISTSLVIPVWQLSTFSAGWSEGQQPT
jgi:hypothetical protein